MKIDFLLAALKFAAIMVAGVLGVMGLLMEYKDRQGKVTKWGRRALIGVIASALVASISQGIEVYKQKHEARDADERRAKEAAETDKRRTEENQKTQKLLYEISRGLYPLTDVSLDAIVVVKLNDPKFTEYLGRVDRVAQKYKINPKQGFADGIESVESVNNGEGKMVPHAIVIDRRSALFPKPKSEELARLVLGSLGISVNIHKHPVSLSDLGQTYRGIVPEPELAFSVEFKHIELSYVLDKQEFRIIGVDARVNNENWHSNGIIMSLPDLSEAQLVVIYEPNTACEKSPDGDSTSIDDSTCSELAKMVRVESLSLNIANRRFFTSDFAEVTSPYGSVYVRNLPPNLQEQGEYLPRDQKP